MAVRWTGTLDLPLAGLARFPRNPRRGAVDEIRKSVRRHGQYRAIVVRDHDGARTILAGNHTAAALEAEGHATARCEVIECTDDEARRIVAGDNRLGELPDPETGERYDGDDLAALLAGLDGDYDGTGWDIYDVDELADVLGRGERPAVPPSGAGDSGDAGSPGGDAPVDVIPETWGVIVECGSEEEQAGLLSELDGRGHRVRALTG